MGHTLQHLDLPQRHAAPPLCLFHLTWTVHLHMNIQTDTHALTQTECLASWVFCWGVNVENLCCADIFLLTTGRLKRLQSLTDALKFVPFHIKPIIACNYLFHRQHSSCPESRRNVKFVLFFFQLKLQICKYAWRSAHFKCFFILVW